MEQSSPLNDDRARRLLIPIWLKCSRYLPIAAEMISRSYTIKQQASLHPLRFRWRLGVEIWHLLNIVLNGLTNVNSLMHASLARSVSIHQMASSPGSANLFSLPTVFGTEYDFESRSDEADNGIDPFYGALQQYHNVESSDDISSHGLISSTSSRVREFGSETSSWRDCKQPIPTFLMGKASVVVEYLMITGKCPECDGGAVQFAGIRLAIWLWRESKCLSLSDGFVIIHQIFSRSLSRRD